MGLRAIVFLILIIGLGVLGVGACERLESIPPEIKGPEEILLGSEAREVTLVVREEGMGLKRLAAVLVDSSGERSLMEDAIRGSWIEGSRESERTIAIRLDADALGLEEGAARLEVTAEDWSWRSNRNMLEIPIEIDRVPPRIRVRSGLTYVDQGGAAAVVYTLSEAAARDGVEVVGETGSVFYPGHPWPGATQGSEPETSASELERVAIFGVDRDAGGKASIAVVASDRAANESRARWNVVLRPRSFPRGDVSLPASFLRDVVPALADAAGIPAQDPVQAFERINTEMRAANERTIRQRLAVSAPRPLWSGGFLQLANSKVTSRFAEARVYRVDGRPISDAIHYGYDLASLSGADVAAANGGIVRHAGDLGIYGRCVLVDHGLGVASLYGHLSGIDVQVGDTVAKGDRLGQTGATGLAGGDHLHFAILVGPTYVDPVEWWDPKWVREHITVKLEQE